SPAPWTCPRRWCRAAAAVPCRSGTPGRTATRCGYRPGAGGTGAGSRAGAGRAVGGRLRCRSSGTAFRGGGGVSAWPVGAAGRGGAVACRGGEEHPVACLGPGRWCGELSACVAHVGDLAVGVFRGGVPLAGGAFG